MQYINSILSGFIIYFLIKQTYFFMATFEDLQNEVAALGTTIANKSLVIETAIKALEDQVATLTSGAAATPEQLQTIIDGLKGLEGSVDSIQTA